jgi:hypothetical protein
MKQSVMATAVGICLLAHATVIRAEPTVVRDPVVTTDKSIDTRSVDAIVKGLVRDGMTDEEKVLAAFNWIRRVIYHGDGPREYAYNFHNMIHVYGHGSCLRQTTPLWVLLSRMGYKSHNWAIGGHHCMEVFYGDKWHLLDPHMCFYVYDRATPRTIASIEQIKDDPTLVTDAVKEGRACPGFLLCGDSASDFASKTQWEDLGDFPEGRKGTPVIEEPFGRIVLRRGESYTRTWMPGLYWFLANTPKSGQGPRHGCGRNDAKDTVNWPLYEPHGVGTIYRHWGAGYLIYKPDLATDHYADAVVAQSNIVVAAGLALQDPSVSGEIVFSVNCPYVITAGEVILQQSGRGEVKASVSVDQGNTWKPVAWKSEGDTRTALFVQEVNGCLKGYRLKFELAPGTGVKALEIKSHIQLNPYALPHLVPGRNRVTVEAGNYGAPLTVAYNWSEGEGWKTPKSAVKTFSANGEFEIEVAGPKYPRMESLVLSVAP